METQTNITPAPEGSSGVNTVLLVVIILAVVGFGVWWYKYYRTPAPASNNPSINVDVNLPAGGENTNNNAPAN